MDTKTIGEIGNETVAAIEAVELLLVNIIGERDSLRERITELREALTLILPLAKGYAAEHPVGSNQAYVNAACDVLRIEHEGEPNYGA